MSAETFDIPAELRPTFNGLQRRYGTVTPPAVGSMLSAFLPAGLANETRRSRFTKAIGAFVGTTVGKVVLGTTVAVASVGTGQAAGIIDVPGLSGDGPSRVVVEHPDETVADDCVEHDDHAPAGADTDEACDTDDEADDLVDDDADDADDADELDEPEDEIEAIEVDDADDDDDAGAKLEQPATVDQVNEVDPVNEVEVRHDEGESDDHAGDDSDDDRDDDSDHDEDESDDDRDDDSDHDEGESDDDGDEHGDRRNGSESQDKGNED